MRRLLLVLALAVLAGPRPALAVDAPTDHATVVHRPPVTGRVLADFDAPAEPWSAGHRGVDLEALPGEAVGASADGIVTFAGEVAGATWVTVAHADGVTTSYGPLAGLAVTHGQHVAAGAVLGTVADGHHPLADALHWGARRDGGYIDPLGLLGHWRPALLGGPDEQPADVPDLPSYRPWGGRRGGLLGALGALEDSPVATYPGWQLPPNPNHVIGVAGFGSSTGRLPIQLDHLGYDPADITYLSYAGHDASGAAGADQAPYGPEDTFRGVDAAADRLDAQLRAHARRNPGEAVDLVGHSMGGVVVLHWLLTRNDPADPGLPPIGNAVTIASPLEGADLVAAARAAVDPLYVPIVDGIVGRLGGPRFGDQAVADLAPGSPLLEELAVAWEAARDDHHGGPLALGTRVLTLGGSRDLVVPVHRTDLSGSHHVVLPGGHDHVRRTEASRQVIRAFLAGQEVPADGGALGRWMSHLVSRTEVAVGEAVGTVTSPLHLP